MKRALLFSSCALYLLLAVACSAPQSTPEAIMFEVTRIREVTREVQVQVEVTREVTKEVTREVKVPVLVTVTFTPGPSATPTASSTPTITPTFTPTVTPFNTYGCINLKSVPNFWNIEYKDYPTKIYPTYDALNGKCVKLFASDTLGIVAGDYGWLKQMSRFDVTFVIDELTPPEFKRLGDYSAFWGIWEVPESGKYRFLVRRVERFPDLRQPIVTDGFYSIGPEYDREAGQWKSLWYPGAVDNCYWARTDPNTGDIRDNHFGQAGIYVRIINGDLFETDDCAPWVFVTP